MNSKQLFQDFTSKITRHTSDEANAIGYVVFESLFGLTRTDVLSARNISMNDADKTLSKIAERLNRDEPIQYILNEADFFGRKFSVSPSVLIPRPETEELVLQVIRYCSDQNLDTPEILDIGTGSGCIPITLSLEVPGAHVSATDISEDALHVAEQNTRKLNAKVTFFKHDVLGENLPIDSMDIITSNPPYIAATEKSSMSDHVVKHEPHLALFVSDADPLIFYRAIAAQAKHVLKSQGLLIAEINERFGNEVKEIFLQHGFTNATIVKDLAGKDRLVRGQRSA